MIEILESFLDTAGVRAWVALVLLLVGAALSLAAAIASCGSGPPRPAARDGEAAGLGLAMALAAVVVAVGTWTAFWVVLPVMVFQLFLVPVSSHMIARAGLRSNDYRHEDLLVDDTED